MTGWLALQVELPVGSGSYVPVSQQWLLVRAGPNASITRGGQQIYNTGLGKCLDVCTDASVYSQCGHPGNIFLEVTSCLQLECLPCCDNFGTVDVLFPECTG